MDATREGIKQEISSLDIAIKELNAVLVDKSTTVKNAWARDNMRLIAIDIAELQSMRRALLKDLSGLEN
jgi:hypothetical protein